MGSSASALQTVPLNWFQSGLVYGIFGVGALVVIAFGVLVIGGAIWLAATLERGRQAPPVSPVTNQTPLDALKVRYAKGDLTTELLGQVARDLGA